MKLLGLASAIAVAVMLIGTAGAGAKPVSVKKVDLSTRTAVAKYLHSIGVSPKGVVIQRGRFNYAGPNCPGTSWTCTTSRRVVQVAADDGHGDNSFYCTPSTTGSATPPTDCMIVQGPAAHNRATCREHIETSSSSVIEHCSIKQIGQDNKAVVDMLVIQHGSPSQYAEQHDDVSQVNNGGSYSHNESDVNVRILQATGSGYGAYSPAADPTNQNQDTSQDTRVDQSLNGGPTTNDSEASSSFLQIARAGDGTSSQDQNSTGGPDNNVSVTQGPIGSKNDSDVSIAGSSVALAGKDYPGIHQTQGSVSGGLAGSSDQSAPPSTSAPRAGSAPAATPAGRSTLNATIYENMLALGPSTAVQEQHGPTACCSVQSGNPAQDREHIREFVNLFANTGPGWGGCTASVCPAVQTDLNLLDCDSDNLTNGCDGKIFTNVNGATAMASCAGNTSPCHVGVSCFGSSESTCVPASCGPATEGCPSIPPPCTPYCFGASKRTGAHASARRE